MSKKEEVGEQIQEIVSYSNNNKQLRENLHESFPNASFIMAFMVGQFAFVWIPNKYFK